MACLDDFIGNLALKGVVSVSLARVGYWELLVRSAFKINSVTPNNALSPTRFLSVGNCTFVIR
jgi:hypothetical protein